MYAIVLRKDAHNYVVISLYTMNCYTFRPTVWPRGWPKYVGGNYVYELISVYLGAFAGTTTGAFRNVLRDYKNVL